MNSDQNYTDALSCLGFGPGKNVLICGDWKGSNAEWDAFAGALLQTLGAAGTLATICDGAETCDAWRFITGQAGALQSEHPAFPISAVGANAEFVTSSAPLHFPFGSNSPISRLHQLNAIALIRGPDYTGHPAIHLAEVWADVPYAGLSSIVADGEGNSLKIHGYPGCGRGFGKIEKVLRQARILRQIEIAGVVCQSMSVRHLASMAGEMLKGDPGCLLCDRPVCDFCEHARSLTRKQGEPAPKRMVDFEELL